MKTLVITGGTDGIGRELARTHLTRGDTVVVIGRDPAKAATLPDAPGRAHFIPADLALLAENRRVLDHLAAQFPVVDALVLCARHYRWRRTETAEGLEENLALFYLSRHLFSHGLAGQLRRAPRP
ncbi:SDR family NAD(P)-dependent oxidoreductase [Streptomyces litchfieldiae]|uniref:SDR family NAD(P)-dependent oxidoreductase n=1 Tax=Streptomyces litchfieldiae TaxID=3075543 RepID=A0ABU2N1G7_9ACTN|nr:SDR family NAD(P)-dependent oxidoreductase [Streptomyces sp. DSM 44938]MDT0347620.1 SDR family NAD(P)-dependent oxidoreductase [Streptomyces sp. DSM 44938]